MEDSKWIKCTERMPEEHETIFAKSSNKIAQSIKIASDNVLVTILFDDNSRMVKEDKTYCGEWYYERSATGKIKGKVIAWKPLPEPFEE